jgi:membrane fusion protein (multidrug efflux system)
MLDTNSPIAAAVPAPAATHRPHLAPSARNDLPLEPTPSLPGQQTTTPSAARRPYAILGIVGLAVALLITGYLIYASGKEDTDDAQVAADVVPVAARVPGQVLRVLVVDNQVVKKGEVLLEIDPSDLGARARQAEAELATARAQAAAAQAQVQVVDASSRGGFTSAQAGLSGSSAAVEGAQAQVVAARAGLVRAQADAHRAELDWTRAQDLYTQGAMAKAALDNAQATYETSQAAIAQAQAQLTASADAAQVATEHVGEARGRLNQSQSVSAQIAIARANADLATARVDAASAVADLARFQLGYATIVAPNDGVASKLSVHPGQLVQVGQPLLELVPHATYVIANFKETQIGSMHPGQRARVHVDAYDGAPLEARVESLAGATGETFSLLPPDNASGNFVKVVQRVPVRLSWVNPPPDLALRPGLSADVTVYVK